MANELKKLWNDHNFKEAFINEYIGLTPYKLFVERDGTEVVNIQLDSQYSIEFLPSPSNNRNEIAVLLSRCKSIDYYDEWRFVMNIDIADPSSVAQLRSAINYFKACDNLPDIYDSLLLDRDYVRTPTHKRIIETIAKEATNVAIKNP